MKTYSSYKNTNIKWIGDIPREWVLSRIKYVLKRKISDGPSETPVFINDGIPFLSVDGIQKGELVFDGCRYISQEDHDRFQKKCPVEKNDILMSKAASIGKIARVKVDFQISVWSPIAIMKPKKDVLNFIFFEYSLTSTLMQEQIDAYSTSNTQKNISMTNIQGLKIITPPLEEQRQIADYLDKKTLDIDKLVEKTKQRIKLLKEQRIALISDTVTKGLNPNVAMKDTNIKWIGDIPREWGFVFIKRLCQVKRGSSPRPIDNTDYFDNEGDYSWVRISDVSLSGRYLTKTKQTLSKLGSSLSTKRYPNDLFLSIAGTVGTPIITKIKCCIHDGFVWFDGLNISQEFLYYIFLIGQCFKGLGKMGTQLNLNTDTVGVIKIPIPPLEEQKQIVEYLDKETLKIDDFVKYEVKLVEWLKEYRQALISDVVTGKVDIRDEELA